MAASTYFNTVEKLYIAFYQRPADPAGLLYWSNLIDVANGNATAVINQFATSAEATALYGPINSTTIGTVIDAIYTALYNRVADAAGKAFYVNGFTAGTFTAGSIAVNILNGATGTDAVAINNKVAVATTFTQQVDGRLLTDAAFGTGSSFAVTYDGNDLVAARAILKTVDEKPANTLNASQITTALQTQIANTGDTILSVSSGTSFTLTTAVDSFTGTSNNDTFSGVVSTTAGETTFGPADVINGGAGTDTLGVTLIGAAAVLPAATITSIETLNLRNVSSTTTQDLSTFSGLTRVVSSNSLVDTTVTGIAAGTTVGVTGSAKAFTGTFATALPAGSTVAIAVDTAGTNVAGAITNSVITLNDAATGGATAASIAATNANYVQVLGAANYVGAANAIKTLTVTGTGSLNLQAGSGLLATTFAADLTKVDLSANSGGVTATVANTDVAVTGGSGADVITLANGTALSNKAGIALGAGNDKLLNNGSLGVGTSAVIDGGDGTDTIAATLLQVGNQANIKNFEILDVAAETRTIDASLFTASTFNSLALSAALTGATVVQKLAGTQLNLAATASSGAWDLTASLAGAATSTVDVANVTFSVGGGTLQSFKSSGIETYNVISGGTVTTTANAITLLSDSLNTTSSVVITGANALTIGNITTNTAATTAAADVASALTAIDGSAATGNLTITAGASAAIGATAFNTTYTGLKITTGSGNDTITSAAKNAVIVAGAGDDTITITGSGASVDTGAAKTAAGDVVNFGGANQSATFGTGVQTAVIGAGAAVGASLTAVTKITGAATGDKIDLSAALTTPAGIAAVTDVTASIGTAASLAAALNVAEGLGAETGAGDLVFFRWVDGNTYILADKVGADAGAAIAAADSVVQLIGSYSALTAAAGVVTIG